MSRTHDNLEEFEDPPNYDIEEAASARARIPYFVDLVTRFGGPVLELACGSGLITLPMASGCSDVTGVDLSRSMLDHARAKAARLGRSITWHETDARSLSLGRTFEVIILTGNAFQAFLTAEDQCRLLQTVRRHLSATGVFVFETRNPDGYELIDKPLEEFWYSYQSVSGDRVRVSGTQAYDPARQLMHWTTYRRWADGPGETVRVSRITCRFTGRRELLTLLADNGFSVSWQHGDWSGGQLTASSANIITGCRSDGRD
ncbi:MAG TPA: class I SAM-dependent methyltransferase [Steroidobacteraceae bacterium]|nr:class I SAM-dependent methyltransferase [Steroidobacteraceae bacterium]